MSTEKDERREANAAFMVTELVNTFVDETTTWLQESGAAFNACFEKAMRRNYTTDDLVKDAADQMARSLKYLSRLMAVGLPDEEPGPGPGAGAGAAAGKTGKAGEGQA